MQQLKCSSTALGHMDLPLLGEKTLRLARVIASTWPLSPGKTGNTWDLYLDKRQLQGTYSILLNDKILGTAHSSQEQDKDNGYYCFYFNLVSEVSLV